MSIELRPLGVTCNLGCHYCYQNPQRDAGNFGRSYDIERMKAAVLNAGGPFTLFGGEPLMIPVEDLEALWSFGLETFGHNGIQTNGSLINDSHIALFRKYRVNVGISIDGPDELNDFRWAGNTERTRSLTAKTESAIERLCAEGIFPSLIITLHRQNAVGARLRTLHRWVSKLEAIGITAVRLHLLESESEDIRRRFGLTTAENIEALVSFSELPLKRLRVDVFEDLRNMLLGHDDMTTCVWNVCDPYTTRAVQGVEGNGQRSNCGRTNKDGVDFRKADEPGYERYIALYHTPQEAGGCEGCRFFLMCKGQCPGTAIDGDWRNRTEHCEVWKTLYQHVEERLLDCGDTPLSVAPIRRWLEQQHLEYWAAGKAARMWHLLDERGASSAGKRAITKKRTGARVKARK